jgi:alkanesulfonate monooxygenase SsuD/methylene tetrahydromethanopterin reductase-like flavin-dependent oxidoreductase (luciferase family)
VQAGGPPIIVGGGGPKRTPRLATKYAAEYNLPFAPLDRFVAQRDVVRGACEAHDRDPDSMIYSAALVLCCGADEAEFERRAAALGREPAELRENGAAGTPDEVAATIRRWNDAGAERLYLQVLDLADLDHLDLVAEAVATQLG